MQTVKFALLMVTINLFGDLNTELVETSAQLFQIYSYVCVCVGGGGGGGRRERERERD